jgi:hypothetical protein
MARPNPGRVPERHRYRRAGSEVGDRYPSIVGFAPGSPEETDVNLLKIAFILVVAAGGYNHWRQYRATADALSGYSDERGFLALPPVNGRNPASILVIAAENCPHDDAQRADRLAEELLRRGLPVVRAHSVRFSLPSDDRAVVARIETVLNGPLPLVFVHGRAKANPTLGQVLAEYADAGRTDAAPGAAP